MFAIFAGLRAVLPPGQVFFGEPGKYCYSLTILHVGRLIRTEPPSEDDLPEKQMILHKNFQL